MTTSTPKQSPRTITIQVSDKGKMRWIEANLMPPQGAEPYQKKHQLSKERTYDDGRALIDELKALIYARQDQGQGITPDELLPILEDIDRVLVSAGTTMAEVSLGISIRQMEINRWLGPKLKVL
ncbi:MAG: hypothetical protein HQM03_22245 [Magnetococcales bacterium]|nr:hypothetical protein [Magnetococcales bacterium]